MEELILAMAELDGETALLQQYPASRAQLARELTNTRSVLKLGNVQNVVNNSGTLGNGE